MHNRPYTLRDLCEFAKDSCAKSRERVLKHRSDYYTNEEYKSTRNDWWDPPRVVVACASMIPPFMREKRCQSSTLRAGHPALQMAYRNVGMKIGTPLSKPKKEKLGKPCWEPGHCAEPHAAHALLNTMDKYGVNLHINQIQFGIAFKVMNSIPMPYCNTCKAVFPQLR